MTKHTDDSRKKWASLAVLSLSLVIISLDNTILNVALPTLVRDLKASTSQLQWIMDAYIIVFAGLLLTGGSLGDRFGRKWTLFVGLAIFGLGSGLSAFASSSDVLIGTRAFMGIGGALIMPATLSIITNTFKDPRERAKAISIWSGVSGLGVAIGPLAGGWLLQHFWWGSIFLINVPITIISIAAGIPLITNSANPNPKKMDFIGVISSIAGLGLLLWAIIEAPSHGWTSRTTLLAFFGAIVILTGFVIWEKKTPHSMLDIKLFSNPRFSAASTSVSLVFFALFGSLFLITQYFQFILGFSPLQAGLRTVPLALMITIVAPISVRVVHKIGTKITVFIGMLTIAVGLFWFSSVASTSASYTSLFIPILLIGIGMGTTVSPSIEAVMGSLPRESAGVGSAMNSTNMQVGGALGVAITGSLSSSKFRSYLNSSLVHHGLGSKTAAFLLSIIKSSIGTALALAHHMAALPLAHTLPRTIYGAQLATIAKDSFTKGIDFSLPIDSLIAILGAIIVLLFLPSTVKEPIKSQPIFASSGQNGLGGLSRQNGYSTNSIPANSNGSKAQGKNIGAIGQIINPIGKPIGGAILTLSTLDGHQVLRASTHNDGSYQLDGIDSGSYVAVAAAPGFLPTATTVSIRSDKPIEQNFILEGVTSTSGMIRSAANSQGIAGAVVNVIDQDGFVVAEAITTSQDGTFSLNGLSNGQYIVSATAPGFLPAATTFTVENSKTSAIDLVLETGGSLTGKVISPTKTGVAGMAISAIDQQGQVVASGISQQDGSYSFSGLMPGSYTVVAAGFGPVAKNVELEIGQQVQLGLELE